MLDGCHGAKTDHTPWAPGQHQPIGAQYGGCLTNQGAAQGPAASTRADVSHWTQRIDTEDCDTEVICHLQSAHQRPELGDQSEDCTWPMSRLVY